MTERSSYIGSIGPLIIDDTELLEEAEETGWYTEDDAGNPITDDATGEYLTSYRGSGIWRNRKNDTSYDDEDVVLRARSGKGVNYMPLKYSTFENNVLPSLYTSNCTATLETSLGVFGSQCLKTVSSASAGYVALTSGRTTYNIRIKANSKWLVSVYVRSSGANTDVRLDMRLSDGTYITGTTYRIVDADTWYRFSQVLDASSYSNLTAWIRLVHVANGTTVYSDGFMVEEYIGDLTITPPSPFCYGVVNSGAITTDNINPDAITTDYYVYSASDTLALSTDDEIAALTPTDLKTGDIILCIGTVGKGCNTMVLKLEVDSTYYAYGCSLSDGTAVVAYPHAMAADAASVSIKLYGYTNASARGIEYISLTAVVIRR